MDRSDRQPQHPSTGHVDLRALLMHLCRCEVRFLVTGSVAALAYGVRQIPHNLDIIVADSDANQSRLRSFFAAIGSTAPAGKSMAGGSVATQCGQLVLIPAPAVEFTAAIETAHWTEAWQCRFPVVPPEHLLRRWQDLDRPSDWPRMEQLGEIRRSHGRTSLLNEAEAHFTWAQPSPRQARSRSRKHR